MTVYSTRQNVSYKEKLSFMKKLLGDYYGLDKETWERTSFIRKFNNSYGYKCVLDDDFYGYESPDGLLRCNATFLNKENELITFVVENKKVVNKNERYSYETLNTLLKFQSFLYKVFQDIRIEFKLKDEFELSLRDFALGYFMTCFAYDEHIETEFSAKEQLKQKDVEYIENIISQVVSFVPKITQFWCETCYEHDKTSPYHIQVDNAKWLEEYQNSLA